MGSTDIALGFILRDVFWGVIGLAAIVLLVGFWFIYSILHWRFVGKAQHAKCSSCRYNAWRTQKKLRCFHGKNFRKCDSFSY